MEGHWLVRSDGLAGTRGSDKGQGLPGWTIWGARAARAGVNVLQLSSFLLPFCVFVRVALCSRLQVQGRGSNKLRVPRHVSQGEQATLIDSAPKTVPNGGQVTASKETRLQ